MDNVMIKRVVKMTFHPDKVGDFLSIFDESKEMIRRFPGCRHLELWQCQHPQNLFFTYSHWESTEHLEHYRRSEFFKSTWNRTKLLFAGRPEAWSVIMVRDEGHLNR